MNRRAISQPIPIVEPVTTATLPASLPCIVDDSNPGAPAAASPSPGAGYRGFWTGIRRQSLFLLVKGALFDLKHGGRFGHMRNPTRP
jgi:hypothetical protein